MGVTSQWLESSRTKCNRAFFAFAEEKRRHPKPWRVRPAQKGIAACRKRLARSCRDPL